LYGFCQATRNFWDASLSIINVSSQATGVVAAALDNRYL
jgi:hypothetical protein